jgi:hypothetical protein
MSTIWPQDDQPRRLIGAARDGEQGVHVLGGQLRLVENGRLQPALCRHVLGTLGK